MTARSARTGVLIGAVYGLAYRVFASNEWLLGPFQVMTVGFLFVVPLVMGFLTVRSIEEPSLGMRITAPWGACGLVVLGSVLTGLEGAICIVFASPVMLLLSSPSMPTPH